MGMNKENRARYLLEEIRTSNSAMKLKAMTEHRTSPGLSNEVMLNCSKIDGYLDELNALLENKDK